MMTQKRFFEIARQVKWKNRGSVVRRAHGSFCPLAFVALKTIGKTVWGGLDHPQLPSLAFQFRVIEAADTRKGRTWLLRNLGLTK